jgi:hypothetical protein
MKHELKTDSIHFKNSWQGLKPWEIRFNDRDFKRGDTCSLVETVYTSSEMKEGKPLKYTGRSIKGVIELVEEGTDFEVKEGWVVLTFRSIVFKSGNN